MPDLQPHTPYGLDGGWSLSAYVDDDGHLNVCIRHEDGAAILDTERTTGDNPLDLRYTTTSIEQAYVDGDAEEQRAFYAAHTYDTGNPLAYNVDGILQCLACTPQWEREADYTAGLYSDTPWYPGEQPPFHCEVCGATVPLTPGDKRWYTQWKTPS